MQEVNVTSGVNNRIDNINYTNYGRIINNYKQELTDYMSTVDTNGTVVNFTYNNCVEEQLLLFTNNYIFVTYSYDPTEQNSGYEPLLRYLNNHINQYKFIVEEFNDGCKMLYVLFHNDIDGASELLCKILETNQLLDKEITISRFEYKDNRLDRLLALFQ
jgi:hypothetical protein